jgi:hypothetical protein
LFTAITQVINGQQQAALGGISPADTVVAPNIPAVLVAVAVTVDEQAAGCLGLGGRRTGWCR